MKATSVGSVAVQRGKTPKQEARIWLFKPDYGTVDRAHNQSEEARCLAVLRSIQKGFTHWPRLFSAVVVISINNDRPFY